MEINMELLTRKRQMLYKNDEGGRIMVRINLPYAEKECNLNELYEALCVKYLDSAKNFVAFVSRSSCFLEVYYKCENIKNYLKIKRISTFKQEGQTVKITVMNDWFYKDDLQLKK